MIWLVSLVALTPVQSVQLLPELKDADVVGEYSLATGFYGETINLRKGGTVKATSISDVIIPGEERPTRRTGTWTLNAKEGLIQTSFSPQKGWPKTREFIPVRWDGVMVLVESDSKRRFCDKVNEWRANARKKGDWGVYGHFGILIERAVPRALGPILVPKPFLKSFPWIKSGPKQHEGFSI